MNDITIFNHLGNDIRVITDNQGEPLFVLKDVCDALDLGNNREVARRLDSDGVSTTDVIDNLGRKQQTNVVTEAGLYEVIFMSRKPEAKAFKRWVTHEVLPSIRKRGGYLTPEATREALRDPDFIIQLATDLKEERAARAKAEAEVEAQRPVAALGKILSNTIPTMGPNKFCRWLLDNNFAFRNGQGKIIPCRTL